MIVYKTLQTTIQDIVDVNVFCSNEEAYVMSELSSKFLNACYQGIFITDIEKITKISNCNISSLQNAGKCYVFVEFVVKGEVFFKGDIIVGVKLTKDQFGIFRGVHKNMIHISILKNRVDIADNSLVNVQLNTIEYNPMHKINATATVMICKIEPTLFNISGRLEQKEILVLEKLREKIKEQLDKRQALIAKDEKLVTAFDTYYYSFKKEPELFTSPEWVGRTVPYKSIFDIDFQKIKPGVVARSLDISPTCPHVKIDSSSDILVKVNTFEAFMQILAEIYNNLIAFNQMAEVFTLDTIKQNKIVFKSITEARI